MRVSLLNLIIALCTMQVLMAGHAAGQGLEDINVTVELNNGDIKTLFKKIEKQTKLRFAYDPTLVRAYTDISLPRETRSIKATLDLALEGTPLRYRQEDNSVIIYSESREGNSQANQQDTKLPIAVSGTITDSDNTPLPGVNVVIKGTTMGTTTDQDGHYTIHVDDESAVLVFSFVGFKPQEQTVGARTVIDVRLEPEIKSLDEVVVLGYGTQKKAAVSGSVVTVDGEDILRSGVANLTGALAGKTPGILAVQSVGLVGQDNTKIYIRGKGTLGNTDALIVIDGIPDRGSFARLNPEDIESITVLKDASAAIYGARAANGVILVTTKRGSRTREPEFNVTTSVTTSAPTVRTKAIDSWKWAQYEKDQIDNLSLGLATTFNDQQISWLKDGSKPDEYPNTNWFEETIQQYALTSNVAISTQGGNELVSYFVSAQHQSSEQIYKGDFPFKQYQLRGNFDFKLTEKLSMGLDMMIRREDGKFIKFDLFDGVGYGGGDEAVDETWRQSYAGGNGFTGTWPWLVGRLSNGMLGKGAQPGGGTNPIGLLDPDNGFNRIINDILNTKLSFDYKIGKGFSLAAYGAFDNSNLSRKTFQGVFREYLYDSSTGEFAVAPDASKPALTQRKTNSSNGLFNFKLNYETSFGRHDIDAFVAYEQSKIRMDYIEAFRGDFGGNGLPEIFAGSSSLQTTDGRSMAAGRINYFGRVNYGFRGTYLATFTLRRDGSQNFPKDNRYGIFPAISGGWVVSNESFLANFDAVNFLKVRASWGQMGNDNIEPFQYLSTYAVTDYNAWCCGVQVGYDFGDGERPGFYESAVANPEVTWETASTKNIGLEGRFLSNTISLEVDVFASNRRDILIQRSASFPDYTGIVLPDENLGKVDSRGFEIQLGYQSQERQGFTFYVNGNISKATNEVVFLDEPIGLKAWQKWEGKSIDSYYGYESNDLYRTAESLAEDGWTLTENVDGYFVVFNKWFNQGSIRLVDKNGDGDITTDDQVRSDKSLVPTTQFGLNLGVSFKNFDASVLFQGQAGGYYHDPSFVYNHDVFDDRWSPSNPDAKYPIPTPYYGIGGSTYGSDFWLIKSDYIRLKNVNVSYRIPTDLLARIKVSEANIFLRGSNLAILKSENKNRDPETGRHTNFLMKSLQLGINVNF